MSTREEILNDIRNILKNKDKSEYEDAADRLPPPLENIMPVIPPMELAERLESELKGLGCATYRAATFSSLEEILRSILDSKHAQSVVVSRNPILGQLKIASVLRGWGITVSQWPANVAGDEESGNFRDKCFAAAAGITGVDFALAETGSLVLTSFTEGSQLTSLAPPIHIALYRHSQIRASLDEVLRNLPVSRDPERPSPARSAVFITGTSRTADIEQVLVRGVHGPREVHAILVEESCLAE
ncbi:MAG TPA: lactate utilization protein [Terriglobia bacterium]|nr:lactate utilization protein [Terriglobia bacterium]